MTVAGSDALPGGATVSPRTARCILCTGTNRGGGVHGMHPGKGGRQVAMSPVKGEPIGARRSFHPGP